MTTILLIILKLSVMALLLAIGMLATLQDVAYLWRRPGMLAKSLLAMYVLVPVVALLFARFLPLPPGVQLALFVLAVSAGAPLLPRKLMDLEADAYVISLVVTASFLAVITVPAWASLLGPLFDREPQLQPMGVGWVIAKSFLLPLSVGMAFRYFFPEYAIRFAEKLLNIAGMTLSVSAIILLTTHIHLLAMAGWTALLALAGLTFCALLIGHWLGGPDPDQRTALATCCATRHIGLAIVVAAAVPGPKTAVFVAAYLVASAAVIIPYLKWRRRVSPEVTR